VGDCEYQFTTEDLPLTDSPVTTEPLTLNSSWTYNTLNVARVNFTELWTAETNAAMGIIQTKANNPTMGNPEWVRNHERTTTSSAFEGSSECTDAREYKMPCIYGWPYQSVNNDWEDKTPDQSTGGTLIAWGSPYGWLGATHFEPVLGDFLKSCSNGNLIESTTLPLPPV
jgi:hypothetical protein